MNIFLKNILVQYRQNTNTQVLEQFSGQYYQYSKIYNEDNVNTNNIGPILCLFLLKPAVFFY